MSCAGQTGGAHRQRAHTVSTRARFLTWLAWVVLLSQQVIDAWSLQLPWVIGLFKVLPLLLFLPGMLRDNLRSYIWLCFICLGYFMALVERLFAQPGSILAMVGMVAVVVLFTAAMLYVRWRAQELRAQGDQKLDSGE